MAINFQGYLYDDSGSAIQGATVQLLQESDGAEEASTTTSAAGLWYFNEADQDKYDIKITRGSSIRYIQWNDQISLREIDVRNDSAATTPALTATNLTNSTANQVAVFSGANTTRADNDEVYMSFKLADSAGNLDEFARMTVVATDVTSGSEDGQIEFDVLQGGSLIKAFTIASSTAGAQSIDFNQDSITFGTGTAATDITLTFDAESADGVITWMEDEDYFKFSDEILMNSTEKILFGDTGTFIHQSADGVLTITSDTTVDINGAVVFDGALSGITTIASGAITSTGIVTGTGFTAGSAVLAEAELELLDGLTAGTAIASKVVTTDANIDTTGQRNLTITGELDAATLDISGNSDFDGTLDVAGNTVISAGTFTVGSDGSGQDVVFYSGTSGDNLTWDSSEEVLQITGTNGATALDVLDGDVRVVDKLYFYDRGGEYLSSDGSTLTITGATTVSGGLTSTAASNTLGATSFNDADITNVGGIALDTITSDGSNIGFGTDGSGEDVYFYSATSGDHMFWDASDEKLVITGTDGQNSLEVADGNVTITDNLTVSGNFTVSGTTTTVDTTNLTVTDPLIKLAQGTTASPANDLGIIFTRGNGSSTNIANRAILWDESADEFVTAFTNDEAGTTTGNVDIDDYANLHVGAITADDNSTFTGTISAATGSTIGNITLANGSITDSSGAISFGNENISTTGTATLATVDIGAGAIDGTTIGASSAAAGTFAAIAGTTGTFSGIVDITDTTDSSDATGDTGALRTEGGASIAKKLYVGTDLDVDGTAEVDNLTVGGAQGSDGQVLTSTGSGVAWEDAGGAVSAVANGADNRVVTFSSSTALNGESGLTYDGSTLAVTGDATISDDLGLVSDGAVLTFGADSEITLTHVADTGLNLKHTATGDDSPIILTLQTGETAMENLDTLGAIRFQAPDEASGSDAILVMAEIAVRTENDITSGLNRSELHFSTAVTESAINKATMVLGSRGDLNLYNQHNHSFGVYFHHSGKSTHVSPANSNVGYVSIGANPSAVDAAAINYLLPNADGTSGQVLSTNGSGQLSWVDN